MIAVLHALGKHRLADLSCRILAIQAYVYKNASRHILLMSQLGLIFGACALAYKA